MLRYILFVFLLIIGLGNQQASAQAVEATAEYSKRKIAPSRLDKENWAKITKDVNYTPDKPKDRDRDPINFPDIDMPNLNIDPPPASAFAVFGQILLWGLVALVVGFIIFRLATLGWGKNKKVETGLDFSMEDVEANLMESDLDKFLREAVSKGDYKTAIRLYFLSIIKEMSLRELIHWKKDKTNGNYLSELYQKPLYEPFRRAVRIFEYAWFSGMDFKQSHYQQVEPEFKKLLTQVSK